MADGGVISQIGIADVPLERNRVTNYSGTLFNANRTVAISVDVIGAKIYPAHGKP